MAKLIPGWVNEVKQAGGAALLQLTELTLDVF